MPCAVGLLAGLVFVCAVIGIAVGASPVDLRKEPRHLNWRFRTVAAMAPGLAPERGWITHQLYADAGGDGIDDLFRASDHGICGTPWTTAGAGRDWQTNLPVEFVRKGPCASIDGAWDVDGDGRTEIVSTARTPDGFQWRLDVLDAATGERRWSVDLPAGADDRGDGNWDGFFRAFGPFTSHLPGGTQPALLVGIEAGYDERPRGVLALDARDGRELWRYATGAKPVAANFHIVDLDRDGRQEIVLLGAGVSNLEEGEEVAGFRDLQARLFILNDDGSLRWQRELGEAPASGWVVPADLDADGRSELVASAWLAELGSETLFVLDDGGKVLASAPLEAPSQSLRVTKDAGGAATVWLTSQGVVQRFSVSRTTIAAGARAVTNGAVQVALVADLVGDAAPEALLGGDGGWNWLVDEALRPMALLRDEDFRPQGDGAHWRAMPGGERRLVLLGGRGMKSGEFVVEENPQGVPWALIVAGVASVGVAGTAWRWRRWKLTQAMVKALRLQLLETLVGESHGEIGPLSGATRLADRLLGSFAGMGGDRAPLAQRIRELLREMLDVGLPQLAEAADLAQLARLDEKSLGEARQALAELRVALARIADDWNEATPVDDEVRASTVALRPLVENVRLRYSSLCRLVAADFTASPGAVLARSLAAHDDTIARLGVEVSLPRDPAPDCFIDVNDLAFVLDNLIENALRALGPMARRRLAVDWRWAGDMIAVHVQDSGVGMTENEAEAAFEPGEDKREGGGRGLPGSRARLRKYEGKLIASASAPGEGTTMVLYLRAASTGAATTAPEVSA